MLVNESVDWVEFAIDGIGKAIDVGFAVFDLEEPDLEVLQVVMFIALALIRANEVDKPEGFGGVAEFTDSVGIDETEEMLKELVCAVARFVDDGLDLLW